MARTRKPEGFSVASVASQAKIGRESSTGRFLAAAKRMKIANTASPEVARSKLIELGILGKDGKLSKNYK